MLQVLQNISFRSQERGTLSIRWTCLIHQLGAKASLQGRLQQLDREVRFAQRPATPSKRDPSSET